MSKSSKLCLLPGAIADLFAQANESGRLTQADCYGLKAAILSNNTTAEEKASINRLLYAIRRRRIQIDDALSLSC
jgi:hypothetical protein